MNKTVLIAELSIAIGKLSVNRITEDEFLDGIESIERLILMYRDSLPEHRDRIEPEPKKND